jgi:hypothetical protein
MRPTPNSPLRLERHRDQPAPSVNAPAQGPAWGGGARTAAAPGQVVRSPAREPGPIEVIPATVLAAGAAIVAFLGAVLLWRPPPQPLAEMTSVGAINVFPEHDVSLYLAAGAGCLALVAIVGRFGSRRRKPASFRIAVNRAAFAVAVAVVAVLAAVWIFAGATDRLPAGPRIRPSELMVLLVLAGALAAGAWAMAPHRATAAAVDPLAPPERFRWRPADLLIPIAIVAFVYMPEWRTLAGNAFVGEELLHIDYFAMASRVALDKGLALGSTVHVYYGMGWPLALNELPLVRTANYGNFIRLEVVYGCIYFIAVYAFLRLLTRRWQWALGGVVLAVLLQLFGSYPAAANLWRFPSATVLRWMFDVWVFLALLAYVRTRRAAWLTLAGVLVGLALLFQTDTGLYLGMAAGFFWCCLFQLEPGSARRLVRRGAVAAGAGLAVLALGLGAASRWTLTDRAFWDGWLENLRLTRAGATLQPLTSIDGKRVLVYFAVVMATYLVVGGYTVLHLAHRRLSPEAAILGTVALYGFLTFLYFVGRSNPHNLFRAAVPFAIVLAGVPTVLRADGLRAVGRLVRFERMLPWAAMGLVLVMFLAHPGVRQYSSLAKVAFVGSKPEGLCMLPDDICGIDKAFAGHTADIQALAARLREVGVGPRQVAILDSMGPLVYRMADVRPWGRYIPTFPGLFLHSMVEDVVQDLNSSPPDIVVMRSPQQRNPYYEEMWQAMRPTIERGYTLDRGIGPFEVWQRRVAGVPSGRGGTNR